eukprot:scaffold162589_cov13-Tisochrysis_lutea.AAC.1
MQVQSAIKQEAMTQRQVQSAIKREATTKQQVQSAIKREATTKQQVQIKQQAMILVGTAKAVRAAPVQVCTKAVLARTLATAAAAAATAV